MNKHFLAECEREQLHLSGLIQPHGALLVANEVLQITHYSTNISACVAADAVHPGQPVPPPLHAICADFIAQGGKRRLIRNGLTRHDKMVNVMLSRSDDDSLLIELIPTSVDDDRYPAKHAHTIDQPHDQTALEQRTQSLVQQVFEQSGFARVMFYRFRNDGDGEVIAEARDPAMYGSYLGLRFPASDIPQIARNLYQKNPWRLIPDAQAKPIPVEGSGELPDLGLANLRSVSPVHQIYMANMGVRASLSLPVTVAGQLQGLIACHHPTPLHPSLTVLETLSEMVRLYSLVLTSFLAQNRIKLVDGLTRRFSAAHDIVSSTGNLLEAWDSLAPLIATHFESDGAHLLLGHEHRTWGLTLEPAALETVDEWFGERMPESLWVSESLRQEVASMPWSHVAGVLALKGRCPDGRMLRVYLTRQEYIHEVAWGGNPDKPIEHHDGTHGIAPRHSFEKWVEKRMGHSRPWESESRLLGLRLREMLINAATHY